MNMSIPLTDLRGYLANEFSALRTRALRTKLWNKLMGKNTGLARFPEGTFQTGLNRKMLGLSDIPVEKIGGTLYRHSDFDSEFRPLKKHLRDRWVNIYLLHASQGWPPILARDDLGISRPRQTHKEMCDCDMQGNERSQEICNRL
jgi:hypothetical protein